MTDNELKKWNKDAEDRIIKALGRCFDGCNHLCPLYDYKDCKYRLLTGSLDLINRQKAEIEALIAGQETLQGYIANQKAEIENLSIALEVTRDNLGDTREELNNAETEIERYRKLVGDSDG